MNIHSRQVNRWPSRSLSGGFSLVEAIVAIAIFMFALVGPVTLIDSSLRAAYSAQDNLVASYLALEGVEGARYIRDQVAMYNLPLLPGNQVPWLTGLDACTVATPCIINVLEEFGPYVTQCVGTCWKLNQQGSWYTHAAGPASKYTRSLTVTEIIADKEAVVSVTVSWPGRSGMTESITYDYHLFNW